MATKRNTIVLPKVTGGYAPDKMVAINKTIDAINKGLAGGISMPQSGGGSKTAYFTPTGVEYDEPAPAPQSEPEVDRTDSALARAERNRFEQSQAEAQAEIRRQAEENAARVRQSQIDAINTLYTPKYAEQETEANSRTARARALALRTGQFGSGEQPYQVSEAKNASKKEREALDNEKLAKIELAFGNYDQLKVQEAERLTKSATDSAEAQVKYYKDLTDKALSSVKSFGAAGVSLDDIKTKDPDIYKTLKETGGLSDFEISTMINQADPRVNAKLSYDNGVVTQYWIDPNTNEPKMVSTKAPDDVPVGYKPQQLDDGTLIFYPEKFDAGKSIESQVKFMGKYAKPVTGDKDSSTDIKTFINQQMATPAFKKMTEEQKIDFIRANGGTPSDFDIY